MKIPSVDYAIRLCQEHLRQSGAGGTEIEAYLTQFLLLRICAEFEGKIEEIVLRRVEKLNDAFISSFVASSLDQLFRNILTSEIKKLLKRFGGDYQDKFSVRVTNTKAETFFNNIVTNRHDTAHKSRGSALTLAELVGFYEEAHTVLDVFEETLLER